MSSIHASGVHPIPFRMLSIWFHIALEHARIITNDISTMHMGADYWIC